jgi:hypothetical protein
VNLAGLNAQTQSQTEKTIEIGVRLRQVQNDATYRSDHLDSEFQEAFA